MHYQDEAAKEEQITLSQFPLLPGDEILLVYDGAPHKGWVAEVGSANPEYVVGGPSNEGAGVIRWHKESREDCAQFLKGEHIDVRLRLKKSMWAVIELDKPIISLRGAGISISTVVFYTYEILRYMRSRCLTKRGPEN